MADDEGREENGPSAGLAFVRSSIETSEREIATSRRDIARLEVLWDRATPFEKKWGILLLDAYRRRLALEEELVRGFKQFLAAESGERGGPS